MAMREPPKEQEGRLWSALPRDILRQIVEQLSLVDRIRFRTVCKDWLIPTPIHDHNLPWIMNYRFTYAISVCLLSEPFCRQPYVIEDKPFKRGTLKLPPKRTFPYATVCSSRSGWVLFSKNMKSFSERVFKEMVGYVTSNVTVRVSTYFVYNVLTKKIMTLPDLRAPEHQSYFSHLAAFSSVPTFPDCVFFVPHASSSDQIFISTYSIGDKSWKTRTFTCPHAESYSAKSVVYMEGSFYCFSERGLLASFNIATQEWRPLVSIMWDMPLWPRERYFLEYGGRLIIVFMKKQSEVSRPECDIFRFDLFDRVWMKMESLEGGAIFLGKPCFGVPAGEKTKMVANRVYYFLGNTPKFITYGPVSPGIGSGSEERMVYPHTLDPNDRLYRDRIWIDPPLLQP